MGLLATDGGSCLCKIPPSQWEVLAAAMVKYELEYTWIMAPDSRCQSWLPSCMMQSASIYKYCIPSSRAMITASRSVRGWESTKISF